MQHADDPMSPFRLFGAERIAHVDGSLATHLIGTYGLLQEWGNPRELCAAGLYHAAYGTAGFPEAVFDRRERELVAELLGESVEELVYLYAACDRDYTYQHVDANRAQVSYRDRFDGSVRELSASSARALLELTLANELEIALRSAPFRARHQRFFVDLFARFQPFVSERGFECFASLFGYQAA